MSQPPGRAPDRHHRKDHNMAVTYTSNYGAPGSQTLPSFRELLPQHLHEEIERTSLQSQSQSRADRHRTPEGAAYKPRSGLPLPHPSAAPTTPASSFTPRGPSPILPPLRDISGRHRHERPMSAYDDTSSRSGGSRYTSSRASTMSSTSMDEDRYHQHHRSSAAAHSNYGSTPPAAMYGNQNAYDPARYAQYHHQQQQQPHPTSYPAPPSSSHGGSSASEYDYSSVSTHSHTLPGSSSNFGVMGGGAADHLDSRGKRRRGNLPKPVTDVLRAWFHEHLDHPYPTEEDKQVFMSQTGLTISQISNWFINARRRQLPALRNQLRNSDGEHIPRGASPMSDGDVSMSPPHSTASPTRRHR